MEILFTYYWGVHCKCKYLGRAVEFDGVARALSGDQTNFKPIRQSGSTQTQYNEDIRYKIEDRGVNKKEGAILGYFNVYNILIFVTQILLQLTTRNFFSNQ